MDRRTRTFIVIAVAIISATVASASVYRAVTRMPVRQVEVAHGYAIVAARQLALGTRVGASDVTRVAWPSSTPLAGAFEQPEDVVGRGVVAAIAANEPITESKLASRAAGAGLAPAIPDGYRAISVKVNEVIGVAGFAVPGAHVDVVATVRRSGGNAISRVLLADVPVLTAGTRYDQEQVSQGKPIPSTVVTLVVTPEQAERIALASTEGNITLMLRNPLDVAQPRTPGADLTAIVNGSDAPAAAAVAHAPRLVPIANRSPLPEAVPVGTAGRTAAPRSAAYTVEVIRAGKRTEETVP